MTKRVEGRGRRSEGEPSFAAALLPLVSSPARKGSPSPEHEPLVELAYGDEIAAKQEGLRRFWRAHRLAGEPEPLVPSPRPRHYRTSSKRRVTMVGGRPVLFLGDLPMRRHGAPPASFVASAMEPAEHALIYRALADKLAAPAMQALAAHLNYLIIRGSYAERALIFNVDELDGAILRRIKQIAESAGDLSLRGCFAYLDPSRSSYHFESRRPQAPVTFKRISGVDSLTARYCGCRYRYHPTSFSQINESIVPELMRRARELLAPTGRQTLLDLYCGYGLFSHFLAPSYARVLGVDAEGPAIRAAGANIRLNPRGAPRRFVAARIDRDFVARALPRPSAADVVLLDPPRNGPMHGVVTALGRRDPGLVLHVFCDVDQIPPSLERWRAAGYRPRRVVPLDMFPGSANLEVLVLLARQAGRD
jgi:tRNA/tmRNA/rRNA uracil-C5-methylase (TrmA/RlmC/RlmD family)